MPLRGDKALEFGFRPRGLVQHDVTLRHGEFQVEIVREQLNRLLFALAGTVELTALPIDDRLNAWTALTANLHDGMVPVDNNHIENLMRRLPKHMNSRIDELLPHYRQPMG